MPYVRLRCITDNGSGELGYIVDGLHVLSEGHMVAVSGETIAHDLLEHQNGIGAIGSIDDELEALGGVWFIRGQFGPIGFNRIFNAEETLGSDVCNLGRYYMHGIDFRTPVPRTYTCEYEEAINSILQHGEKALRTEMEYDNSYDDEEFREEDEARHNKYIAAARHYIRRGYSKAKRRYNNDAGRAYALFRDISAAVEPYVKDPEYEGQELRLYYSYNRTFCEEIYPEY
mgnify:CR=1 FL=1